jgi:hypothetical protein
VTATPLTSLVFGEAVRCFDSAWSLAGSAVGGAGCDPLAAPEQLIVPPCPSSHAVPPLCGRLLLSRPPLGLLVVAGSGGCTWVLVRAPRSMPNDWKSELLPEEPEAAVLGAVWVPVGLP